MNDTKHTPTPWSTGTKTGKGFTPVMDRGTVVAYGFSEIYAAHIVKCVNAHDELVAALEDVIAQNDAQGGAKNTGIIFVRARAVVAKVQA